MARIDDGFRTIVLFSLFPNIQFWEKTVQPVGADGGGANDTTTMRNNLYRTHAPKKLITLTELSATYAYDPAVYNTIMSMINQNQLVTQCFPDGSQLAFYGWLNTFKPNEITEGAQPTAAVTVIASNQNLAGYETGPAYSATTTSTTSTSSTSATSYI
jgi:hypothetical protein